MDIVFKKKSLKKVFDNSKLLVKNYGKENGKIIQRRMSFLRASSNLESVPKEPPTRCHLLHSNYKGHFAIDIKHPFRLIIKPANDPLPLLEEGGIDLEMVTKIEIVKVEDYH